MLAHTVQILARNVGTGTVDFEAVFQVEHGVGFLVDLSVGGEDGCAGAVVALRVLAMRIVVLSSGAVVAKADIGWAPSAASLGDTFAVAEFEDKGRDK